MVKVKEVMQTSLTTISKDMSIQDAIKILVEKKITGLPVVEDDMTLVGIVSEKDVLVMAYRIISDITDSDTNSRTVEKVMTRNVVSFRPDDNLADVCQCFINKPFRRVTIVQDDKLVGLISRKDIIACAFGKNH